MNVMDYGWIIIQIHKYTLCVEKKIICANPSQFVDVLEIIIIELFIMISIARSYSKIRFFRWPIKLNRNFVTGNGR